MSSISTAGKVLAASALAAISSWSLAGIGEGRPPAMPRATAPMRARPAVMPGRAPTVYVNARTGERVASVARVAASEHVLIWELAGNSDACGVLEAAAIADGLQVAGDEFFIFEPFFDSSVLGDGFPGNDLFAGGHRGQWADLEFDTQFDAFEVSIATEFADSNFDEPLSMIGDGVPGNDLLVLFYERYDLDSFPSAAMVHTFRVSDIPGRNDVNPLISGVVAYDLFVDLGPDVYELADSNGAAEPGTTVRCTVCDLDGDGFPDTPVPLGADVDELQDGPARADVGWVFAFEQPGVDVSGPLEPLGSFNAATFGNIVTQGMVLEAPTVAGSDFFTPLEVPLPGPNGRQDAFDFFDVIGQQFGGGSVFFPPGFTCDANGNGIPSELIDVDMDGEFSDDIFADFNPYASVAFRLFGPGEPGDPCDTGAFAQSDVNEDGLINFGDVSAFVAAFNEADITCVGVDGDASADIDGDGMLTFGDVSSFIFAFNAGS